MALSSNVVRLLIIAVTLCTAYYIYRARVPSSSSSSSSSSAAAGSSGLCSVRQGRFIPKGMISHQCLNFLLVAIPPKDGLVRGHDNSILHTLFRLNEAMQVYPLACFTVTVATSRIDDHAAYDEALRLYSQDPRFRFLHVQASNDADLVEAALTNVHCEVCGGEIDDQE
jgi:hypothetical protein